MQTIMEVNPDQLHLTAKRARIESIYSKGTRYYIIALEEAWDEYLDLYEKEGKDAFRIIYYNPSMYYLVGKKIDKFTRAWRRKGLTREDFFSIFWETAWKVTEAHTFRDDYFLYEKIPQALESAGIDYVRSCLNTDKRKANHGNVSLVADMNTFDASYRFEDEVLIRILVEQYCSEHEREIVLSYIANPTLSYADIGRLNGINHHEKVKRLLRSGLEKVRKEIV